MRAGTAAIAILALALSACATARLHSVSEINRVGARCGLTYGELFQDAEEKRLLFLMKPSASAAERACVTAWALKHKLKMVVVESIAFPET